VNDRPLGVVTAVTDSSFAVRMADRTLWLLADAIFYVADHAAKLICSADEVRRYQAENWPEDGMAAGGS
jgi:hypothetical protein